MSALKETATTDRTADAAAGANWLRNRLQRLALDYQAFRLGVVCDRRDEDVERAAREVGLLSFTRAGEQWFFGRGPRRKPERRGGK